MGFFSIFLLKTRGEIWLSMIWNCFYREIYKRHYFSQIYIYFSYLIAIYFSYLIATQQKVLLHSSRSARAMRVERYHSAGE